MKKRKGNVRNPEVHYQKLLFIVRQIIDIGSGMPGKEFESFLDDLAHVLDSLDELILAAQMTTEQVDDPLLAKHGTT